MSADGVSFMCDEQIPVWSKIEISFTIPVEATHVSQVAINAQAKVLRVEEECEGVGPRFRIAASIEMYKVMRSKVAVSRKLSVVSPHLIVQSKSLNEDVR